MKRGQTTHTYDRSGGGAGANGSGGPRRSMGHGNRQAGWAVRGEFAPPKTITPALPAVGSFADLAMPARLLAALGREGAVSIISSSAAGTTRALA
ncbi:hypothetical protein [Streptomyces palmae]|uniref:hypothetical protein n=1 Tax=Streptomyces palmae TaxID=1701085 RepID=UPI0035EB92ED